MIGYLLDQIADGLFAQGYVVGRESSIQITTGQADLFVESTIHHLSKSQKYGDVVASLEVATGTYLAPIAVELDRLFIQALDTGTLVTVVEFVSPNNKIRQNEIAAYQDRREELWKQGVNIVEIDFTCSVKRLIDDPITEQYPYHIVIYPVEEAPYFIGMQLTDAPITFALPLREGAYPAEINSVYQEAYAKLHIAAQIHKADDYKLETLPFPSLFSEKEQKSLLDAVKNWQASL